MPVCISPPLTSTERNSKCSINIGIESRHSVCPSSWLPVAAVTVMTYATMRRRSTVFGCPSLLLTVRQAARVAGKHLPFLTEEHTMSQRNIKRARRLYAHGASLGRIAKALNCTVLSVAYQLVEGQAA